MEKTSKKSFGQIVSNFSMPILLGLLILVFSILSDRFFTPLNLTNILVQNVHIAIKKLKEVTDATICYVIKELGGAAMHFAMYVKLIGPSIPKIIIIVINILML